jgi:DNA-binding NtrC family response regulator
VNHFLARFAADSEKEIEGITPAALHALTEYHWPGNVRQLENSVERAVALSAGRMIDEKDIHLDTRQSKSGAASASASQFLPEGMTLEQWEDNMIREALRRANGNKSQAARLLGLSRNALRYRLGKLGVADEGE